MYILFSRFGLYGLPLEAELFDTDPPQQHVKASSTPLSYATVVSGDNNTAHAVNNGQFTLNSFSVICIKIKLGL